MKPQLGVAILAAPKESLSRCIRSCKDQVDEILIFTWDPQQAQTAIDYGATAVPIETTAFVEPLRQTMQASLSTEWVLILDPDESLDSGAIEYFNHLIRTAPPNVVGFWVPYHMYFGDTELKHSFPSVMQLRLFRRNRVSYSGEIHTEPTPVDGNFAYSDNSQPGIHHHFVDSIQDRLERHLQWAAIEAQSMYDQGKRIENSVQMVSAGLQTFREFIFEKDGLADGIPGFVSAIIHAWKAIVTAILIWELQGKKPIQLEPNANWSRIIDQLDSSLENAE